MKIGVSATGKNLNAIVDQRFGRCNCFLIIDSDTMDFEFISNESTMSYGGAGIQAAQTMAKAGVDVVVTGNIGPNAFQTLSAAGIKVFIGADGTIKEVIEKYKKGELKKIDTPNVSSHSGVRR